MNKLMKIKLIQQLRLIKESTIECENFLKAYKESVTEDFSNGVVAQEFNTVIQHQKNMVQFFSILEQQLQK